MKNKICSYLLLFLLCSFSLTGKEYEVLQSQHHLLRGRVLAGDTRAPLANASIALEKSNISTVTNQEGYFALRVPASAINSPLIIRFLGYQNLEVPVIALIDKPNNHITLMPSSIQLSALEVVSGDGKELVREALRRVTQNNPSNPSMMVAFYRESIKKNAHYISLVEAVLDIYKSSYRTFDDDQAKIYIGRKATDAAARDTILMKFQGGISSALMLDIAKHPEMVFDQDLSFYSFKIDRMININDKPHYVISFEPLPGVPDIVFRGTIFLEKTTLAIARMEFNMNVEGRKDAPQIFIRKKPSKMKVDVDEAHYIVDFTENNGKWYFNYSATRLRFKVRWTNRFFGLFATNYTIASEMAITDRYGEGVSKFPRKERIHSSDVIAEKVEYFQDPEFWGEYNVIEPDLEINNAIKRLSGKLIRRNE